MPNWSDENGRYWWDDAPGGELVEIPHPPVSSPRAGCFCALCTYEREKADYENQR